MKQLGKRLDALEERAGGCGIPEVWHTIIQKFGQTEADALRAYGVEKLGDEDGLLWIKLVAPMWGEDGKMIPQPQGGAGLDRTRTWKEILACGA